MEAGEGEQGFSRRGWDDPTAEHLKTHWPANREQLLAGIYKPLPVCHVEIPKPDGGVRKLGIPVVVDRLIQQAILQVLQRRWDRTFSERSYLRVPAGAIGQSGRGEGTGLHPGRVHVGCGLRSGEIL